MNNIILGLLIVSIIVLVFAIVVICKQAFKIGYYEETLKNHKDKFSANKWAAIERVINK